MVRVMVRVRLGVRVVVRARGTTDTSFLLIHFWC